MTKFQVSHYETMTDEELIRSLRSGEKQITDFIMDKYKNLVRKEAKAMYLLGGENDDLIQEGMIGLFKAVQDYDTEQKVSFFSFARLCVRRQMYSAIEASQRKKHLPLNSYISLYDKTEDGSKERVVDTIEASQETNPETALLDKEYMEKFMYKLDKNLSDLERRVLYLHLEGIDYRQIAELLEKSPKTVDNALQRIKGKVEKIMNKKKEK